MRRDKPIAVIVYHSNLGDRGGAQKVAEQIVQAVEEFGLHPILILGNRNFQCYDYFHEAYKDGRFPFYFYSHEHYWKKLVSSAFKIRELKRQYRILGLFLSIGYADPYQILLPYLTGLPALCYFHVRQQSYRGKKLLLLSHLIRNIKFKIMAPSKTMSEICRGTFPEANNFAVEPPYDENAFVSSWEAKRTGQICSVGRISPEKRFEIGIQSAAFLKRRGIPFRYTIVGDSKNQEYLETLRRLISENNLEDTVEIQTDGSISNIVDSYLRSEVFWNFSLGYGGIVNFEAMACGCFPIVVPNLADIVQEHGLVCGDSESFANSTALLISNPQRTRALAETASAWVRSRYSNSGFRKRLIQEMTDSFRFSDLPAPISRN